ncbi:MAG: transporter [Flavobacteriales bacterium]|nr:transporter [Flavobacteriales bacterium]
MRKFLMALLCLLALRSFGQYAESIRAGRPGQAVDAFTVGKGVFQIESGIGDDVEEQHDDLEIQHLDFGNVIRIGVMERFEVGIEMDWQTDFIHDKQHTNFSYAEDVNYFGVRMKGNIFQGEGLVPSIGGQFNLGFPSEGLNRTKYFSPKLALLMTQSLSQRFGLTTNVGSEMDGSSSDWATFYAVNLGCSITDKLSLFIENYGTVSAGELDVKFDGGMDYLLTNNLKIDLYGGYDKITNGDEFFVSVGLSWRTHRN